MLRLSDNETCSACTSLMAHVERAHQQGDKEKERVMRSLLDTHKRNHHTPPVEAVVVWKDGTRWRIAATR